MKRSVDERNRLNDLTNKEWLQQTKSFWISNAPPRDELKLQHPATFSEHDIERLIHLFTKSGQTVLDPFVGVGSTLIACLRTGRRGIGIELMPRWCELAEQRLAAESDNDSRPEDDIQILQGDAGSKLADLDSESIDFVVTSPPYWRILEKNGQKVAAERASRDLPTNYGDEIQNLGGIEDYDLFLSELGEIFAECSRVLRARQYMAVIVSDFRHGPQYYLYHADLANEIQQRGMVLKGVIALLQDSKNLYAYGIPYAFVPNIHHQQILIFQKPESD